MSKNVIKKKSSSKVFGFKYLNIESPIILFFSKPIYFRECTDSTRSEHFVQRIL